jgi:hypothetical protein
MLSPRIVSFTDAGLFYDCHGQLPTNDRGETLPVEKLDTINTDLKHELFKQLRSAEDSNSRNAGLQIADFWYRAVEQYSAKAITKPEKDRIVAISGVARVLKKLLQKHWYLPATVADPEVAGGEARLIVEAPTPGLEYLSGLWLYDIHYGLLWEQKKGLRMYKEGSKAPSWSWARLMVPVKWADRHKGMEARCEVIRLVTENGMVYSIGGTNGKTQRKCNDAKQGGDGIACGSGGGGKSSASTITLNRNQRKANNRSEGSPNSNTPSPTPFDITNLRTTLIIRGRLVPVLIGDYLSSHPHLATFSSESERDVAAQMTGHRPDFGRSAWRAVCSENFPKLIAGWASLELVDRDRKARKPAQGETPSPAQETTINPARDEPPFAPIKKATSAQALLVATHKSSWVGFRLGMLFRSHDIYHVLYVKPDFRGKYRRIGVGRCFELGLAKEFRDASVQEIELT